MAVLVEAISVIVRARAILDSFNGGWSAFKAAVPNQSLCADGDLARVGFMTPMDVEVWVHHLETQGLVFLSAGKAEDVVVIDQRGGPTTPCEWIEFGHVDWQNSGQKVAAARLVGSSSKELATPEGWTYKNSISSSYRFMPSPDLDKQMKFLRRQNGLDVYLDLESGEELYVGRSGLDSDELTCENESTLPEEGE